MASKDGEKEFPYAEAKLSKPASKTSIFEKHKAEAAAKREREAAEAADALESFVKSFGDDDGHAESDRRENRGPHDAHYSPRRPQNSQLDRPGGQPAISSGTGKRHFGLGPGSRGMKSGPGSLGPPPGSFGYNKKRAFDSDGWGSRGQDNKGTLGYDTRDRGASSVSRAFEGSDDEVEPSGAGRAEEKAVSKPTLRLANLPPATSPAVIEALIPETLNVEGVKIMPPSGPSGSERRSLSAIVTLSQDTPATDIDAAVSSLQNRYLGFGFYLNLHRHLSSAAISSNALPGITLASASTSHPFGAKRVAVQVEAETHHTFGRGRAFAPPPAYAMGPGGALNRSALLHVPVKPPRDVRQLRMIHKVAESVLEHGPEFEALLMSRPEVQRQERWSWIWDARSEGGIWYRWRLWQIVTGSQDQRGQGKFVPLFEGSHAWKAPDQSLPYEHAMDLDEFVSDSEYNSSNNDEYEDEPSKPADSGASKEEQEDVFLNPIEKFKLVHLLARLPVTMSRMRKGDIARITSFAITHASRGAGEVVSLVLSNVERPFAYTSANPRYNSETRKRQNASDSDSDTASQVADKGPASGAPDMSNAQLVALYVVSDILSSASTSGIRHAWRYRQLFEHALRARNLFETLGTLSGKMNWGRLRAEKWKRSVGIVLSLWEGWCVFPAETQELLKSSFENPPSLQQVEEKENEGKKLRWKTVDAEAKADDPAAEEGGDAEAESYSEYTDDESIDLDALELEDIDGDPIVEAHIYYGGEEDVHTGDAIALSSEPIAGLPPQEVKTVGGFTVTTAAIKPSRKRMRASDMFAASDSDDGQ